MPVSAPGLQWLQESLCEMIGGPELPRAFRPNPIDAMVVLTAGGGWIDDSMTGFAVALKAAFDAAPHIERQFKKLKNAEADERHLVIPLHGTALPFSIFSVLQFDLPLPPEPPPVPDHITHLWLRPDSSRRVLIRSRADHWRNFFPYD